MLRSRGVEIIEIDTPDLKTENGIVDTGDALHAWFPLARVRDVLGYDSQQPGAAASRSLVCRAA